MDIVIVMLIGLSGFIAVSIPIALSVIFINLK